MTTTGHEATPRSADSHEATTSSERPKHSQSAQTPASTMPDSGPSADKPGGGRSVSVWAVLALIAGSAIVVVAVINLPNLARWGEEHGNVLVFLAFFLVMSIGGRWFWVGVDAVWGAIRGKGN